MEEVARKRLGWGSAVWMAVLAVPVAAGGYLIYQKAQSFAGPTEVVAAPPPAPEVVAVAPSYADPVQLKRKEDLEAQRLREEREKQEAAAREAKKTRVITVGPSARREEPVYRPEPDYEEPAPSRRAPARKPGPQIYESEEDERDRLAREDGELRQKGVRPYKPPPQPEAPLMPFSGSSSSVGSGNYGSSSTRRSSTGSRN